MSNQLDLNVSLALKKAKDSAVTITGTLINNSSRAVTSAEFAVIDDDTGEASEIRFGRVDPGQRASSTTQLATGFERVLTKVFIENDPEPKLNGGAGVNKVAVNLTITD